MISRFFRKKGKKTAAPKKTSSVEDSGKSRKTQKVITAEGWKRLMMRKLGKNKK